MDWPYKADALLLNQTPCPDHAAGMAYFGSDANSHVENSRPDLLLTFLNRIVGKQKHLKHKNIHLKDKDLESTFKLYLQLSQ